MDQIEGEPFSVVRQDSRMDGESRVKVVVRDKRELEDWFCHEDKSGKLSFPYRHIG